jgi:fibro-slime domain-containing protein
MSRWALLALVGCSSPEQGERATGVENTRSAAADDVPVSTLPMDAARDAGSSTLIAAQCGDGHVDEAEACDDGNRAAADGCSADCSSIEPGFECRSAGTACVESAVCGDSRVEGREQCDDGNTLATDGCDASCRLEPGFSCSVAGAACHAAQCGDGMIIGREDCDDGNQRSGDGCTTDCLLEPGFVCEVGRGCRPTQCGDKLVEGTEQCEDMNEQPFDGCYSCQHEPSCHNAACVAVCGDGFKFPEEACDDGDTRSGDGCSSTCQVEPGFACTALTDSAPEQLDIPIIYRDFRGSDQLADDTPELAAGHPDFEGEGGMDRGIVADRLGDDKKPVYARDTGASPSTTGAQNFQSWYHDDPRNNRTIVDKLTLTRQTNGAYVFEAEAFFPLDDRGFVAEGEETTHEGHNFHFTSELRYWFQYGGDEQLDFFGDDDVWVFVNGRLALDLGGLHPAEAGTVTLSAANATELGLSVGGIYEIDVFQAERHTTFSSYKLTLNGFERVRSVCESVCGDGIVTSDERCDDGKNDGSYGSCGPDCRSLGPHCGDGVVQAAEGEQCDDGNREAADGCDNGCQAIDLQ